MHGGVVRARASQHGMFYDACTSVTIEGRVESIQWKNPHILIDLKRMRRGVLHWMLSTRPSIVTLVQAS